MKPTFIVVALSVAGTGFARPANEGGEHPKDLTRRDPILGAITTGASLISGLFGKNKKKKPEAPKAERVAFDANTCMCNDASGKKSTWDDCFQCCDTRGYSDSTTPCKSNCFQIPVKIGNGIHTVDCAATYNAELYDAPQAPGAAPPVGSDPYALAAAGGTDNRALPASDPNIVPWSGYSEGSQGSTGSTGAQYGSGNAMNPYGNGATQNGGNYGGYRQGQQYPAPYSPGNQFENAAFQSDPTSQTNAGTDRYGALDNQRSSSNPGLGTPQAGTVGPSGYAQYQETATDGNPLAYADQRRTESTSRDDSVPQTGSGSSGIPDDTQPQDGVKPEDTQSPEGATAEDTQSPEGATPEADSQGSTVTPPTDEASPDGSQDPVEQQPSANGTQSTTPDDSAKVDTPPTPSPISPVAYGGTIDSSFGGVPGRKLDLDRTTPLSPREEALAIEAARLRRIAAAAAAARRTAVSASKQDEVTAAAYKTAKAFEMSQMKKCAQKRKSKKSLKFDIGKCRDCCEDDVQYVPGTPTSVPNDKHNCYQFCVDSEGTLA
ncbi:MAG: hypothetical protein M1815_001347 [Lichina confinis]|nr:MAG: hypothetical protein M1815_001347 [Lichina confinis]